MKPHKIQLAALALAGSSVAARCSAPEPSETRSVAPTDPPSQMLRDSQSDRREYLTLRLLAKFPCPQIGVENYVKTREGLISESQAGAHVNCPSARSSQHDS